MAARRARNASSAAAERAGEPAAEGPLDDDAARSRALAPARPWDRSEDGAQSTSVEPPPDSGTLQPARPWSMRHEDDEQEPPSPPTPSNPDTVLRDLAARIEAAGAESDGSSDGAGPGVDGERYPWERPEEVDLDLYGAPTWDPAMYPPEPEPPSQPARRAFRWLFARAPQGAAEPAPTEEPAAAAAPPEPEPEGTAAEPHEAAVDEPNAALAHEPRPSPTNPPPTKSRLSVRPTSLTRPKHPAIRPRLSRRVPVRRGSRRCAEPRAAQPTVRPAPGRRRRAGRGRDRGRAVPTARAGCRLRETVAALGDGSPPDARLEQGGGLVRDISRRRSRSAGQADAAPPASVPINADEDLDGPDDLDLPPAPPPAAGAGTGTRTRAGTRSEPAAPRPRPSRRSHIAAHSAPACHAEDATPPTSGPEAGGGDNTGAAADRSAVTEQPANSVYGPRPAAPKPPGPHACGRPQSPSRPLPVGPGGRRREGGDAGDARPRRRFGSARFWR